MGQTVSAIPPKGYQNLQGSDFVKGIGVILFGSISAMIIFLISQDHWPSWKEWQPYVISAVTTLFGYIGKNYFTNNEGKMFQGDAPVTTVSAPALEAVVEKAQENK